MKLVYLDNNATTQPSPEVVQAMVEMLSTRFGNPSSIHRFAERAREPMEHARRAVASLVGCRAAELIFTSGATESIATAFHAALSGRSGGRIVTTAVEHPAVLENVATWHTRGFEVGVLGVDERGAIALSDVDKALDDDVALVVVMMANNETGVLYPVAEVAARCRAAGVPLLVDASQAVGKVPVDLRALGVDYAAFSAHKLHGPKGVGALYVRRGAAFSPLIEGGGQEKGRRSGTYNAPGIVGMGVAAQQAAQALADGAMERVAALRDRLEAAILAEHAATRVNGAGAPRLPNTTNVSFEHASGEAILQHLDELGVAASSSSACASNEQEPSHVLRAMAVPETHIHGSMRVGLSRYTTDEEVDLLLAELPRVVALARKASPFVATELPADYVAGGEAGRSYCE